MRKHTSLTALFIVVLLSLAPTLAQTTAAPAQSVPQEAPQAAPQAAPQTAPAPQTQAQPETAISSTLAYISHAWDSLSRNQTDCKVVAEAHPGMQNKTLLYVPADVPMPAPAQDLQQRCGIAVKPLPMAIHHIGEIKTDNLPPGLLYLEHPYVVPGGMFNEMYGWDSYFIIRGLVRDGRIDMARGIVENFLYEIEHYGGVLNANRTYFLTRSQPPFLTSMILAVVEADKKAGRDDTDWLRRAYPLAVKDHDMWRRDPHLAGKTGLSRYYDFGQGPVPEVMEGHDPYYKNVAKQLIAENIPNNYLVPPTKTQAQHGWPSITAYDCKGKLSAKPGPGCKAQQEVFTRDYYKGDRSMRESGFDVTFRFGPYGGSTHHFAPVCLNSLLYKTEKDLEQIATTLGMAQDAQRWHDAAATLKEAIDQYLWDAKKGMYFDYRDDLQRRSDYQYASTFYPLWAGAASPDQARAVLANLSTFEKPGGIVMSPVQTGVQWDFPYGWAPVNLVAVEGLRRYGFNDDANRISHNFVTMIVQDFQHDHTIREKYNVVTRSTETKVQVGYQENMIGFGWTNGTFLTLLQDLPQNWQDRIARGDLQPIYPPEKGATGGK